MLREKRKMLSLLVYMQIINTYIKCIDYNYYNVNIISLLCYSKRLNYVNYLRDNRILL